LGYDDGRSGAGRRWGSHARGPSAGRASWPRRVGFWAAVASIVAGVALAAHVYLFYWNSEGTGAALIHQEQGALRAAQDSGRCAQPQSTGGSSGAIDGALGSGLAADAQDQSSQGQSPKVEALLRAPSIGLEAPVAEGTSASVLSVAVGHVPASSWPGTSGTVVLAAHDVTWFSHVDQLAVGSPLVLATPCRTYLYRVTDHRVVVAGTPIDQTVAPRLVLVTCYPLNALFLTSERYVVEATLSKIVYVGTSASGPVSVAPPVVPAPVPLAAQGLDLAHNPAPLGSLSLTGTPSPAWEQSTAPLDDEGAVLELYFAALRSAEQGQAAWWAQLAPTVPFTAAAPLAGATVVRNDALFDPVLVVDGGQLTGASLTTEPVLAGGRAAGTYRVQMLAGVTGGQLVVTGWNMAPVG